MIYTTYGSVRGQCGHRHTTLDLAVLCLMKDRRDCKTQGGYSDREIMLVGDDGYLYRDMGQDDTAEGNHWVTSSAGGGIKFEV